MGGIFGCICKNTIKENTIIEGLKRLLYRGYDGAGVAFLSKEGKIIIRKAAGHLEQVARKVDLAHIPSKVALSHTRYASRGWPVDENTHPLTDCYNRVAVVGDGIIENFEEVREKLVEKGHKFKSRTDIEVFAHLLEETLRNNEPLKALALASRKLRGIYSIAFLLEKKNKIYVLNKGQHIVIGVRGDKECVFISSDIPSLHGFADEALILEENMAAEVGLDGIRVINIESLAEVKEVRRKRVKYAIGVIDKAGYPHFMLKEIYEAPEAIIRTTATLMEKYLRLASMIIYGAKNVYIIGNGTSLYAGLVASYYFTDLANLNVNVVSAAEFPYYALENVSTGTVILAISQSGETRDVINSIKLAKQRGAVIVGVTNVVGSRLTLESNVYLPVGAGPEIAVPATKTFVSTLTTLAILAAYTGLYTGTVNSKAIPQLINELRGFAKELSAKMEIFNRRAREVANKLSKWNSLYVVSSGVNYPIALEAALKLKEAALIHAEGVQLGELRHGPMVLISNGYPIIFIKPFETPAIELYNRTVKEALNKGAFIITITHDGKGYGELIETINVNNRILAPIASIIPLQLIAYRIGCIKNLPIDAPPGLAKAITT